MSSSSFPIDPLLTVVVDASVVINLNATGRARDIIRAVPNPFATTGNVIAELAKGERNGHSDGAKLWALIEQGHVGLITAGTTGNGTYESLIEGAAEQTLDDGEATTIACAVNSGSLAMIDERKARTICARRFPKLLVASTVELLLHEAVEAALGKQGQIEVIIAALRCARMRVPPSHIEKVVALIGEECAASCDSLPKAARVAFQNVARSKSSF